MNTDVAKVLLGKSRHPVAPSTAGVKIGTGVGNALFVDGVEHVMVGPALFQVN